MSSKSRRRDNKAAESRRLEESQIEQRALAIAEGEGRTQITQEDRARAEQELLAPNEVMGSPENPDVVNNEPVAKWDEPPGQSGTQAPKVGPEDENSVNQQLFEKGMRVPTRTRRTNDVRLGNSLGKLGKRNNRSKQG